MYDQNHLGFHLRKASLNCGSATLAILDDGEEVTYDAFFARAEAIAAVLQDRGLCAGDRVAVKVGKSIDVAALYVGTVLAGGIYLPLNTAYTVSETQFFLSDAEPKIVVCDPNEHDDLAEIAGSASMLTVSADRSGTLMEEAGQIRHQPSIAKRGPEDPAAILYTSGTTGRSKGAVLSHRSLVSNAEVLRKYWRITADDILIHALPIYHVHGLFVALNCIMFAGGSMLFRGTFDPGRTICDMANSTMLMGVPTYYTRMLENTDLGKTAASNMRLFISGSAPLLTQTHQQWRDITGHAILERYGMTETGMNTSNPYEGERRPGTVGFPLPGIEVRVCDPETGAVLQPGEIGGVEVRGSNLFSGYWRMPEKTEEEHRPDGYFITGDLGQFDKDGYLSIVGRSKDLIITGGLNVYPKEIESILDGIAGVYESAVVGLAHRDFGEGVAAVVVPLPGHEITAEMLQRSVADKLANFKQPKRYFVVDTLPRNAMGKVQKKVLRDRYQTAFTD